MLTPPPAIMICLDPVFSRRVWQHVLVLVVGAILTSGQCMVNLVLRVTGLSQVPSLFDLFSLVSLLAHQQRTQYEWLGRQAVWHCKARPTFTDALALVRRALWTSTTFQTSSADQDLVQIPRAFVEHLTETLCYTA